VTRYANVRTGPKSAPASPLLSRMRDTASRLNAAGSDDDSDPSPTTPTPTENSMSARESHASFAARVHKSANPAMQITSHFDRETLKVASSGWAGYFAANRAEMDRVGLRTPAELTSFLMLELGAARG